MSHRDGSQGEEILLGSDLLATALEGAGSAG